LDRRSNSVVSIIVPARNEEACLGACLDSLVAQTGSDFEIIVVDDASTDSTAEIARSFEINEGSGARSSTVHVGADALVRPDIRVIPAGPLPDNWTGKNNAMTAGAKVAKGKWLLFTDADTFHKPGSLARAVAEAEEHNAALLSYSPEQEVHGFWEKAVMPVIFAELAATYPPAKVNDPASPIAAANGQYLLISREAYDAVGGHTTIASDLLEDVAMARLVKSSGRKIFFRYGGDAVRTRMYRSFAQLKEGWTKNLALLFPNASVAWDIALRYLTSLSGSLCLPIAIAGLYFRQTPPIALLFFAFPLATWLRIRKAHFSLGATTMALYFGQALFFYLLLRSRSHKRNSGVIWKNRKYLPSPSDENWERGTIRR